MSPHLCDNYLGRSALLVRMVDGDLAPFVAECVKEEIRRVLHYVEPVPEPAALQLAEADE